MENNEIMEVNNNETEVIDVVDDACVESHSDFVPGTLVGAGIVLGAIALKKYVLTPAWKWGKAKWIEAQAKKAEKAAAAKQHDFVDADEPTVKETNTKKK